GRRQVVDDRVEDRLHAAVTQRGAAQHRNENTLHRAGAKRFLDLFLRDVLLLEVFVHDAVVEVRHSLDEVVPVLRDEVGHAGRDVQRLGRLGAEVVGVDDGLLAEQVDVALEAPLGADGQLDGYRARAQAGADRAQRAVEVVAADVIVIPRSFSWTIQSMVAAPSWTSPILWMRPA